MTGPHRPSARRTHDDVARERIHREAVGADVVHHHHQHVLGGRHREQPHPEGDGRRDVEAPRDRPRDGVGDVGLTHRFRGEIHLHPVCGQDHLARGAVDLREHGAQRTRAARSRRTRPRGERRRPARRSAGSRRRCCSPRILCEAVEEPHPLLCHRQRERVGALLRHERGPGVAARGHGRVDECRELRDGGASKEVAHIDADAQVGVDACDDAGGAERVATEREVVVVDADALGTEDLRERRGECLLGGGGRCPVLTRERREVRGRRALRSSLPAGVSGNSASATNSDGTMCTRVGGRSPRRPNSCRSTSAPPSVTTYATRWSPRSASACTTTTDCDTAGVWSSSADRSRRVRCADAQLHLEVGPADVLQLTGAAQLDQVTGPVHARARAPYGSATNRSAVRSGRCR